MKTVSNLLTILFTIFLPIIAILCLGVPSIIKAVLVAAFLWGFYQLTKYYFLAKALTWNRYYFWYIKRILTVKEFRTAVYHMSDHDHLRLQALLSSTEYDKVLKIFPEDKRGEFLELHQKAFHQHVFTKHAF